MKAAKALNSVAIFFCLFVVVVALVSGLVTCVGRELEERALSRYILQMAYGG